MLKLAKESDIVYDPFMGTGTTAAATVRYNQEHGTNLKCLGSELSSAQCDHANARLQKLLQD